MISRRILRIKLLQVLYSYFIGNQRTYLECSKELYFSLNKTMQLYFFLFLLIVELKKHKQAKLEQAKEKYIPSEKDLNPNTNFIDNKLIKEIENNSFFNDFVNKNKLSFYNQDGVIAKIFTEISDIEEYKEYMDKPKPSLNDDISVVKTIYKNYFISSDLVEGILEDMSIYWIDSIDFVIFDLILRDIDNFSSKVITRNNVLKNNEDQIFIDTLLKNVIDNNEEYDAIIKKNCDNWDLERICIIDKIILKIAIAEISTFPNIPLVVSTNEFIEIAKVYSTEKSYIFINGMLDKISSQLRVENKIFK